MGAITHDVVGHIENPFMDTFRDRNGNINIHGDRDNNARLNANCNGDCRMQGDVRGNVLGNVRGNLDGITNVQMKGNVDSNMNAKFNGNGNGNAGLNLNLHFGLRRTNPKQSRHAIFVPIDELTDVENLSSFGYSKRHAVFCLPNNIYE